MPVSWDNKTLEQRAETIQRTRVISQQLEASTSPASARVTRLEQKKQFRAVIVLDFCGRPFDRGRTISLGSG